LCLLTVCIPFSWHRPTVGVVGIYIGIGFFGYLTLLFLDKALELAPAALTAPLIYLQPIWLDMLTFLSTGNRPGLSAVAGAMIIIATVVYIFATEITGTKQLVRIN
jgi:drug/metabolite transporter (DMT)-like permease